MGGSSYGLIDLRFCLSVDFVSAAYWQSTQHPFGSITKVDLTSEVTATHTELANTLPQSKETNFHNWSLYPNRNPNGIQLSATDQQNSGSFAVNCTVVLRKIFTESYALYANSVGRELEKDSGYTLRAIMSAIGREQVRIRYDARSPSVAYLVGGWRADGFPVLDISILATNHRHAALTNSDRTFNCWSSSCNSFTSVASGA
ncbi:MAG: hypothetical protein KDB03_00325 [Planctomycetales bacterium]|nr:hypothetical protein [Planctomycetales bacterium]